MKRLIVVLALMSCSSLNPYARASVVPTFSVKVKAKPKANKLLDLLLGRDPTPAAICPADGLLKLEDGIDDDAAEALVDQFAACKGRRVALMINSPGGSLFAAQKIQKAIEAHDKPVLCVVDGMAASAAFVTLQSCTSRYMTSRSVMMAHHASLTCKGQHQELENCGEALRVVDEGMSRFCAKRMGMSYEEFDAHVSAGREWWFGLADGLKFHALDGEADSVTEIVKML